MSEWTYDMGGRDKWDNELERTFRQQRMSQQRQQQQQLREQQRRGKTAKQYSEDSDSDQSMSETDRAGWDVARWRTNRSRWGGKRPVYGFGGETDRDLLRRTRWNVSEIPIHRMDAYDFLNEGTSDPTPYTALQRQSPGNLPVSRLNDDRNVNIPKRKLDVNDSDRPRRRLQAISGSRFLNTQEQTESDQDISASSDESDFDVDVSDIVRRNSGNTWAKRGTRGDQLSFYAGWWLPRADVLMDENGNVRAEFELPGVPIGNIRIMVADDHVIITTIKPQHKTEKQATYWQSERHFGNFYRRVDLPDIINQNSAQAVLDNGVLKVTMRKLRGASRDQGGIRMITPRYPEDAVDNLT